MLPSEPTSKRTQLWDILHNGHGRVGHTFSFVLLLLILLSITLLPLELLGAFQEHRSTFYIIEVALTTLFTVEYFLRIYAAPQRLKYCFSFLGIIDLLAILPFYLGLVSTQYVRAFRLIRLIRILKITHIQAAENAGEEKNVGKEFDLLEGETIEHVVSKHPVFFLLGLVPVLFMTIAALLVLLFPLNPISLSLFFTFLLFAILFLYKAWLDYRHDVIYVTSHRLILQNWDLLGRDSNQISYRAITNVKPQHTGVLSYLLGFGSIVIETASEQGSLKDDMVRSHEKSAHIIMQQFLQAKQKGIG